MREQLEVLASTSYGRVLREYLKEKELEIGDIRSCTSWEETLGRKFALSVLKDLFLFLDEKKEEERKKTLYT